MDLSTFFYSIIALFPPLLTFLLWRLNRTHQEALAALNHSYSKEASAASHLYTRRATHLERASVLIGNMQYWAGNLFDKRTQTDLGERKEMASKMSRAYEDLSLHILRYPFVFGQIKNRKDLMKKLMESVNCLENKANAHDFSPGSKASIEAVDRFVTDFSPVTEAINAEIVRMMEYTSVAK